MVVGKSIMLSVGGQLDAGPQYSHHQTFQLSQHHQGRILGSCPKVNLVSNFLGFREAVLEGYERSCFTSKNTHWLECRGP